MNEAPHKRKLALAIGISSAEPLPYLRGAINGAREFHHWAATMGYESELLTDASVPVTIEMLRDKLKSMLSSSPDPIFRLILYFAGHGLIREVEEGLWLLSDWNRELRAVAVEVLKRRLYMYGVEQISIFADACRSLPVDVKAADLTADGVLGRGPVKDAITPAIDKFIAAQDGTTTFMVPGASPSEDRCLFSGVLMEGLWGAPPAVSAFFPGKVTSQSLGQFLMAEVPQRAKTYQRKLNPIVQPLFPLGQDVYFGDQQPPPTPPAFLPWPDPNLVLGMGPSKPAYANGGSFDHVGSAGTFTAGLAAGIMPGAGIGLGALAGLIAGWGKGTEGAPPRTPAPPPPPVAASDPGEILRDRIRAQQVPMHFETGSGIAVAGATVSACWLEPGRVAGMGGRSDWWHISGRGEQWLEDPAPLLVELTNGLFLALTALPDFIAAMVCDARGIQALLYREVYSGKDTAGIAARAISQMESGALRADDITDLAVDLRQLKHADPTLGVIGAYLYDSIGDVESIRRMAYYYSENRQAIPYDIALLADVEAHRGANGLFYVTVPAVPARQPRTESERRFSWTHEATVERTSVVGGLWPWMRQGWTFLDDPSDFESGLIHPGIPALRSQLTSARFTTLSEQGGNELAMLLGLIRWPAV